MGAVWRSLPNALIFRCNAVCTRTVSDCRARCIEADQQEGLGAVYEFKTISKPIGRNDRRPSSLSVIEAACTGRTPTFYEADRRGKYQRSPFVRCYSDCVAKLFAALRERNNRICLNGTLNQCCVFAFVLESMLLVLVMKIVLQHNHSNSGHSPDELRCPLLLSGANNTHIATLVERHTRFVMLLKVPSKDTATVVAALGKHVRKLPQELRRSLTWDRGKEMADHKSFTVATNVQVYFCDPHSPWQRGSNENTNGLLRQYFPRGTDLSCFSQGYLNRIALRLNQRPRKTLGFESPADRLQAVLQ